MLYYPAVSSGQLPGLIMANGFSGTMDWVLPAYARRFAEAGFAVLVFDYRHFGQSEGVPRQLVSVRKQRQDLEAAVDFARHHNRLDPNCLALWGTSLGGGHVLNVAARDPRLRAIIAQVPAFDMVNPRAKATVRIPLHRLMNLLLAAVWDAVRGLVGASPWYCKVYGSTNETAVFTDPALQASFEKLTRQSRYWQNRFTPRFYLNLPRYKPGTAEQLIMPLLVCVARRDVYANPVFQTWVGKRALRGKVIEYDTDHFAFYHGLMEQVVTDQLLFLRRWMTKR
ncbi:alpha/beta hydrolase [Larkinella sp. VNQ87]|uniref:alpha/beta hydrolase n=1 Tax=Larkinella sp. VNQ87 TaxID=3400921 RepID=UPI003C0A2BBE